MNLTDIEKERRLAWILHGLQAPDGAWAGSAGFQACCVADFQVGGLPGGSDVRRVWKPAIQQTWKSALRTACEISGSGRGKGRRFTGDGCRERAPRSGLGARTAAFTLIEMLVVIAIIGILAAMIFPVTKGVNRTRIKSRARTEMEQIVTALELYKAKRGQYPPDNHLPNGQPNPYLNQLYYELAGTTNWMSNPAAGQATYQTLDGRSVIASHAISVALGSGVAGFVNSASGGSSEEGSTVVDCLRGALRPDQLGQVPVQGLSGVYFNVLVCSVPLSGLPAAAAGVAPYPGSAQVTPNSGAWCCAWRYNSSSPTHNPTSYDLWVDLIIDGRTNRFSNWSRNAVVVSSP